MKLTRTRRAWWLLSVLPLMSGCAMPSPTTPGVTVLARHPGATQSGPTSADPIGLLAELLGEADGMAEVYAAEADRARVAGWRASVHTMRCALPAASVGVEYCGHARPIYFDSAQQVDATPAGVRRQVLEGNETWRALCRH